MPKVKPNQVYTLPSGNVIKINSPVAGARGDWNCSYMPPAASVHITMTGAFLCAWARPLAGEAA